MFPPFYRFRRTQKRILLRAEFWLLVDKNNDYLDLKDRDILYEVSQYGLEDSKSTSYDQNSR